jgi:uncharacterized membrane protein
MRHNGDVVVHPLDSAMNNQTQPASPERPARHRPHLRCAVCGKESRDLVAVSAIRPALEQALAADHPNLAPDAMICRRHLIDYRTRYVEEMLARERGELSELDRQVVESLAREELVSRNLEQAWSDRRTTGERVADLVADFGGSWKFIISFIAVLLLWIAFNIWAATQAVFDPYPFILLNLVLSCVAALQAPIIMMSQKRQEAKDRLRSENDYRINLKAELEIRNLHEKMDHLINRQWERLTEIQQIQLEIMQDLVERRPR